MTADAIGAPAAAARRVDPNLILGAADGGIVLQNLVGFARLLRRAGISAGADKIEAAARALGVVGVARRADVFWALAAVFVERREQLDLFRQAFYLFWRARGAADDPPTREDDDLRGEKSRGEKASSRLLDDWESAARREMEIVAAPQAASAEEILRGKDFERMSDSEWRAARELAGRLRPRFAPIRIRRKRPAARGAIDLRRTARAALRAGGEAARWKKSRRIERPPRLVALLDISGSMSRYARAFAHFVVGAAGGGIETRAFLFGTRLSFVGRRLPADCDLAAARVAAAAADWGGGTQMTASLREFNRKWSRRVLGSRAIVLLATDGLERDFDAADLTREVWRIKRSCRRLLWLNPLLRYDGYEALARGAKIISEAADETRPIHNVESLADLALAVSQKYLD